MKSDQEKQFEIWFQAQPFYVQEVYKHGETLFIKDCGNYKHAAVRIGFAAWKTTNTVEYVWSNDDLILKGCIRDVLKVVNFFAGLSLVLFIAFLAALGNCS